jgi:hypothetical protein
MTHTTSDEGAAYHSVHVVLPQCASTALNLFGTKMNKNVSKQAIKLTTIIHSQHSKYQ